MSLSLIIGSSGSGKSTNIYTRIIKESMENKDKNFLVIVPEQYTMSTQRLLVSMHPNKCIMNIDVLSFNRLAYRVFEELGAAVHDVLDDTGKALVIRKLADSECEKMQALGGNIKRINYITQVKSLISELTQYNITPEKLQTMIDTPTMSQSFKRRASDLLIMYKAFLDFIEGKYVTTESILSTLNMLLEDSQIVNGSTVVLDGFTGFTPIQYQLVENMLKLCDEVAVTITADVDIPLFEAQADDKLFAMSSEFAIRMNGLAKGAHVEINDPVFITGENGWLSENGPLSFLEKNIFRNKSCLYQEDASESIYLRSLRNPRDELRFIAITINRLVRQGMRYKDIAVVAPNLEEYRYMISGIWKDYDIPYFVDAKTEILFHPMSEALDALFDIFTKNFRREDVMRFLKSGLTDLSYEEIDFLENYLVSTGIRGKNKYFHPFAIRSNAFSEDADLLRVNEIRNKFAPQLETFSKAISKNSTVRGIATALYMLITSFGFEKKINERREKYEDVDAIKTKEYSQIYQVIMNILDKLVAILGDEVMDLEEFHDVYAAGLSAASIGVIPPANDSVIVGDIERTRLSNIKVLFCLGATDTAIPKKVENGGILSQLEREQLLDAGFELAPSDRQKSFRQRFYLYLMLTKPNQKLYITVPRVNISGDAAAPSYLIGLIEKMFETISLVEIEEFDLEDKLLSQKSALDCLIELLNTVTTEGFEALSEDQLIALKELLHWAKENKEIHLEKIFDAAFFQHKEETVSSDIMLAINEVLNQDETVSGSVTKFECYNQCAYKYFLNYILRLKPREEFELSSIDLGNFCHDTLRRYSQSIKEDKRSWHDISADEREPYITQAIQQTFESMPKVQTLEDDIQRYIIEGMKDTLRYTVDVITEQVKRGGFEPAYFEENIEKMVNDAEGEPVAKLIGKVDRIDVTADENKAVRIIDYKSSARDLDLKKCYAGISMQLPIYMGAVLEKLQDKYPNATLHPAGMLYYKATNEFVDSAKPSEEDRLKQNQMTGYILDDKEFFEAFDSTFVAGDDSKKKSSVVNLTLKKDGAANKQGSSVLPEEDMHTLMDYSYAVAAETATNILEGKFDCRPAKEGATIVGCEYCDFKAVCHFDENVAGYRVKQLDDIGKGDVIGAMKEKLEGKGEDTSESN